MFPLLMRPAAALAGGLGVAALVLATRSPGYPLALAALPPAIFGLLGENPLPRGVVTSAVAVWIAVGVAFAVLRREDLRPVRALFTPAVVLSVLLLVLMVLRVDASEATAVGDAKVQLFLAANLVFLVGGIAVGAAGPGHFELFVRVALGVATAGALVLMWQLLGGTAQEQLPARFTLSPENDPISLGRANAAGLLLAVYVMVSRASDVVRACAAASIPLLAVGLFASGSRGPLLAAAVGLVVFTAFGAPGIRARRGLAALTVSAVAAIALIPQLVPGTSVSRTLSLITPSEGFDTNGRATWWELAYETFADRPLLGIGTGGFAAFPVSAAYPHNLLLEVAAELGIGGLLLVVGFIVSVIIVLLQVWRPAEGDDRLKAAAVMGFFAAALTNAMFSGAIANNHAVWLWGGVGTGLAVAGAATRSTRAPQAR